MGRGNVVIAGTYPPPIGGVTIHIMRLKKLLDDNGYRSALIDIRPINSKGKLDKFQYIKRLIDCSFKAKNGVLHYQLNNWIEACLLAVLSKIFRVNLIYTVHSFRNEEFSFIKNLCFRITSKYVSTFLAPSFTTKEKLILSRVDEGKISVLNTYLPPTDDELNKTIPIEIVDFINRSNYVVLANGSRLYRDTDKTDVYGLDMCIEVCASLPEISFIFCVPKIEDKSYLEQCLKKISDLGIVNRFMIYTNEISLVSLFKYVDLFVRPTSTDSYGVSVAEALSCKIPVVASDVCKRTKGANLFKSRDTKDYLEKIKYYLDRQHEEFSFEIDDDYFESYRNFYDSLLVNKD